MDQVEQFQRHDLVWMSTQGWSDILAQQAQHVEQVQQVAPTQYTPALAQLFLEWQQQEWPAVVRRRDADAAQDEVCIGFALPPRQGHKPRIAGRVKASHILEHQSALALSSVMTVAPQEWRDALRQLQIEASAAGIRFRVYGSLAMQFLTGQTYLNSRSDIDLLFRPQDQVQLATGLSLLAQYQKQVPLDGEIIFPAGQAVAWKEWLLSDAMPDAIETQRVLVKELQQVRLMSKRDLMHTL